MNEENKENIQSDDMTSDVTETDNSVISEEAEVTATTEKADATEETDTTEEADITEETASESSDKAAASKPEKVKQSIVSELFDYLEIFVCATFAVIMIFTFFTRLCRVDGPSMMDTLHDGEMLLITNTFYEPKQGDIVVFHQTGTESGSLNEPIVKRVIATGGSWVDIDFDTWTVRVADNESMENAVTLDEPYIRLVGSAITSSKNYPYHVPEGYLFVMGDNRYHSSDSRSYAIGLVDERRILGHVICRLTPFDKIGAVK